MAKVIIWPDIYKEQGHWLPCVTLAKSLKDALYTNVRFMGIEDTRSIVAPYGFPFDPVLSSIYPPGYSLENKLEPLDQRWKPAHLLPIVRGELDSIFNVTPPVDLLISGYFTALETLLISYKYGVKFVLITTFLRHPDDLPSLHAKTKLLYLPKAVAQKIIDGVVGPAKKGMSIEDFVKPLDADDHPEMIPCSPEFDFTDPDWKHRKNTKYVEPMIVRTPQPPASPIQQLSFPGRVIYATSGSQVQDYEFRARQFFKNLIEMMQAPGMDGYTLVLAVGARLLTQLNVEYNVTNAGQGQSTLPPNVKMFDWVSQLDIMGIADVVFMHGGLATIKESIWEQVPIVIVPHGKDQMDNALRIKRAGVGVASEITELSPLDLRRLLTEAVSSTWIRQNLQRMRDIFNGAETKSPKDSIKIIQTLVSPS